MTKKPKTSTQKRGPKPETIKIEGDWKDAVAKALAKGTPWKRKKVPPFNRALAIPAHHTCSGLLRP